MSKKIYTEEEKEKILKKLNEKRLSERRREDIANRRTKNKKIYTLFSRKCYKFLDMHREYFIEIDECAKINRRPKLVPLYYRTIDEVKTKEYLIKTELYTEGFLITDDPIKVNFKACLLESE